ncbi:MAG: RNA pseudouridine synthase [Clostridia bacterium]|nr:RNA pseudouridine synthase [Clostridia bacterium]
MNIIYENQNIVVCQKEIGENSEKSASIPSLANKVEQKYGYAGVIHRLDTNVGGAIIYAKNKKAAAKFSQLVADGNLCKEYLAVVEGIPKESEVLKDYLFKDSSKNKVFVVKKLRKGVKEASLEYNLLGTVYDNDKPLSLVKIKLHTGRSHQIRVQFSSRKMPLLGDGKYGSKCNKCTVSLWSYFLNCKDPFSGDDLCIKSLPPKENYPWNLFNYNSLQ